jgi:hypothetical protein
MTDKESMAMALEALETLMIERESIYEKAITALKERLADPMREVQRLGQEIEQDHTYGYASRLAIAIWQKHYRNDAPKWKPLETTEGVLTQIDNMTCGLVKEKPPQRTWVGLTEEDRAKILSRKWWDFEDEFDVDGFLRLAEAKLKKKNT